MHRAPSCIANIKARQIFDSRGRPTVEADVVLADGTLGRACVPSGTSTGRHEAWELRDGDPERHGGLGVLTATRNVCGEIHAGLTGMDALDQPAIDAALVTLDGTPSLRRLGANAILATSLAAARAAAAHSRLPLYRYLADLAGGVAPSLPMPMTNILSGGAHVDGGLDFQDFLVIPTGATSFSDALAMISRVVIATADVLKGMGARPSPAGDGGLNAGFQRAEQALEVLVKACGRAGLRPGTDIAIGLDVAASELAADAGYHLPGEGKRLSAADLVEHLAALVHRFPIISVEDALEQDDWTGWSALTRRLAGLQVVGDDLFATNGERIRRGIATGAANAAVIKLNQNGTLSGTLKAISTLRDAGYRAIVAARSGDTEDTFVADLAVGTGAGQVKIGAFRNTERLAKYNQLLRIEEESGLPFAGWPPRKTDRILSPESPAAAD